MQAADFELLLKRLEGPDLDFKQSGYVLSGASADKRTRAKFVKDIVALYNTPRDHTSYIVLGVEKRTDGASVLHGVDEHPDDADLQKQFDSMVFPRPEFQYEPVTHEGKQFGVLRVPVNRTVGPCLPTKDVDNVLRRHQVYFRRSSENADANFTEQQKIFAWFQQGDGPTVDANTGEEAWDQFVTLMGGFTDEYYLALCTGSLPRDNSLQISAIGLVDWVFTIDFDPRSDIDGVLHSAHPILSERRAVHILTRGQALSSAPTSGTSWYFGRGIEGRDSTLEPGTTLDWKRSYKQDLQNTIERLAQVASDKPLCFLAMAYDEDAIPLLRECFDLVTMSFGERCRTVICAAHENDAIHSLGTEYASDVIIIPLHQLLHGLESHLAVTSYDDGTKWALPTTSGAPVTLDSERRLWLSEELEVVHVGCGRTPHSEQRPGKDFLRGHEVSWYDLGLSYDVKRDVSPDLISSIRSDLAQRKARRVNLFHSPGAGGTTVAKRVGWDLHYEWPVAVLRRVKPEQTVERLAYLAAATGKAVLVINDGGAISERESDQLYELIAARHLPVVMLQVIRQFGRGMTESCG